jgi:hypothetical protein
MAVRQPISWVHRSNPLITSWIWETPHFVLTIFAEGLNVKKMYNWKINDKSKGFPVPFDSAPAESFQASVDAAVEVIAKSYPRELGYQAYAGDLATTFTVGNGRRINFASLIGDMVVLTARNANNEDTLITGIFDIRNYDIVIQTGEATGVVIPPERVMAIHKEFGSTNVLDTLASDVKSSRNKRIFHEEWRKGCSGKPGFNAGTVEHAPNDPYCSIHNI